MSDEKRYKLVNGELVELSEEDLEQLERDAAAAPPPESEEPDNASKRKPRR